MRSVRDLLGPEFAAVIVDDEKLHRRLVELPARRGPRVRRTGWSSTAAATPLFERFGLEQEMEKALARRVDLPSGGYIVIDHTEAMTVIDVNTGRYVGKRQLEDTTLKTNLEACREIVRQLRLRDIGGIIVIDFIDMTAEDQPGGGAGGARGGVRPGPHQDLRGGDLAAGAGGDDPAERHPGAAGDRDRPVPRLPGPGPGDLRGVGAHRRRAAPARPRSGRRRCPVLRVEVHPRIAVAARVRRRRDAAAAGGRDGAARCRCQAADEDVPLAHVAVVPD